MKTQSTEWVRMAASASSNTRYDDFSLPPSPSLPVIRFFRRWKALSGIRNACVGKWHRRRQWRLHSAHNVRCVRKEKTLTMLSRRRRRPQNSYFIRSLSIGFTYLVAQRTSGPAKYSHCGKIVKDVIFISFDFVCGEIERG